MCQESSGIFTHIIPGGHEVTPHVVGNFWVVGCSPGIQPYSPSIFRKRFWSNTSVNDLQGSILYEQLAILQVMEVDYFWGIFIPDIFVCV